MSKLSNFISEIKNNGLMRTARYSVILPPSAINSRTVAMFCEKTQLPGINYNTQPIITYGETREVPYSRMFETITLSFYVDNDMNVKKYFDAWLYKVQNPIDRTFSYYNDYTKPITIIVEDLENVEKYQVTLHECYPKNIGSIDLDYASRDIMKLQVTFAYRYWEPTDAYEVSQGIDYLNTSPIGILPEYNNIYNGITDISMKNVKNTITTNLKNSLNDIKR